MSSLTNDLRSASELICFCVDAIQNPSTTNTQRFEANEHLNRMLQDIVNLKDNPANHLTVAYELISHKSNVPNKDFHLIELYVYYGFKMLESIIKYRWYQLDEKAREFILQYARVWCRERFFAFDGHSSEVTRLATSKLVLGICSHCISEIFIRTWPSNWPSFVDDITRDHSLLTLYILQDISYYLNNLLIPENANRRKEIIFDLTAKHMFIYEYIDQIWCHSKTDNKSLEKYCSLVFTKSLELMESLLNWFPIAENNTLKLLTIATSPSFDNSIRLNAFRCIQVIINRTKIRNEEARFVEETFFNFDPSCFAHCLLVDILPNTVAMVVNGGDNDNEEERHEILTLVFEISTDIVCKAINLYNQISTSKKVLTSYEENQHVWHTYLESIIKLMNMNVFNINNESSLQKFLLQYSRFDRCNKTKEECSCEQTTRIPIQLNNEIDFRLLELVCRTKMQAIDEIAYNKKHYFVSYEQYVTSVRINRSKYIAFIQFLVSNNLEMGKEFIIRELNSFLQGQLNYPIQVLANFCSIIVPKLEVDSQTCLQFEQFFEQLFPQLSNETLSEECRSNVLSFLSSMWRMFAYFQRENIHKLLTKIFDLTLAVDRFETSELRNHSGSLFIRLALNCANSLLPYLEEMRAYIDQLISSQKITNIQFCILYEGLIVLTNHLDLEQQRTFFIQHVLDKLTWLKDYDFGVDGFNFFTEIGLAIEPDPSINELTFFRTPQYSNFSAAIELLTRIMKRIEPRRLRFICWPELANFIKPISDLVECHHRLWRYYRQGDSIALARLVHSTYWPYVFDELPNFYMIQINVEQPTLMLKDRLKVLLAQWNRTGNVPPSPELIGYHVQGRLWRLHSNSVLLLSLFNINILIDGHLNNPEDAAYRTTLSTLLTAFATDLYYLPTISMREVMRYYLNDLACYSPRADSFVFESNLLVVLDTFIRHVYQILDRHFQALKEHNRQSLVESHPASSTLFNINTPGSTAKYSIEANLELCNDAVISAVLIKFVHLLQSIFSNMRRIFTKTAEQSSCEIDEEEMEEIDAKVVNEKAVTNNNNNNEASFSDENFLSRYFLLNETSASALVQIVTNTLLWPMGNMKRTVVAVVDSLINSLIYHNRLQSTQGFAFFFERILPAYALLEHHGDPECKGRLATMFISLYDCLVLNPKLMELIDAQMQQLWTLAMSENTLSTGECSSARDENCNSLLKTLSNISLPQKKRNQAAKTLLETIAVRSGQHQTTCPTLALLHSVAKPVVHCLTDGDKLSNRTKGAGDDSAGGDVDDGHDSDILLSLSWLF